MTTEVKPIYDSSGWPLGYIAKGYISPELLESSIREQWDKRFCLDWATLQLKVEHTVMRCIPCRSDWSFEYHYSDPGRGAFECTVVWCPL